MNNQLQETLLKVGMEPTVIEIYLILIENGEMTVPQILEKTQLSRATVYEALPVLLAQGFLEYRKIGRVAYYKPTHPSKLFSLIEERKREVALLEGEMGETIRSITGLYNLASSKPGVRFFEGVEGLKEIYLDTLSEKEPIYALLSPSAPDEHLREWLDSEYVKKRVEKTIHASVIATTSEQTKIYTGEDEKFLRDTRVIPADRYPVEIEIDIYGKQKVAFISYKSNELFGVILDSPAIYKSMKTFFMMGWNFAHANTMPPKRPLPPVPQPPLS